MAKVSLPGNTPYNRSELIALRSELARLSSQSVREFYVKAWDLCGLGGDQGRPPRPSFIQQLVQAWRELDRRTPKGRD
jgi:hypothetical protein